MFSGAFWTDDSLEYASCHDRNKYYIIPIITGEHHVVNVEHYRTGGGFCNAVAESTTLLGFLTS